METNEQMGGCMCGNIRYTVSGEAIWPSGCCCRDCAKATGTPYVVWVGFPPERVRYLSNAPRVYTSSEGVLRGFCETCGTSLTYGRDPAFEAVEPTLYISAATLDDPDAYPPTEVVWYGQRPSWFELSTDILLNETISVENAERSLNHVLKNK